MRKILSALLLAASALGFSAIGQAQNLEGLAPINPPLNTSDPDKIEVVEFMWFGCPHCYSLEPHILAWREKMPENAVYIREAPPLNDSWKQHSQALYAARILEIEDEFAEKIFHAIHQEKKRVRKPSDIAKLAAELGVDKDKFESTMKSFAVMTKLTRASQLAAGAGLTGVPAVMINGKYLTSASIAGSHENMIEAINRAIELESAAGE